MNKEQFEKIENRIREASEHVSPPFSEENWEAMNLLLDQEFPEKRRRRIFFLWFWPLLGVSLAGGVLINYSATSHRFDQPASSETTKVISSPAAVINGDDKNTVIIHGTPDVKTKSGIVHTDVTLPVDNGQPLMAASEVVSDKLPAGKVNAAKKVSGNIASTGNSYPDAGKHTPNKTRGSSNIAFEDNTHPAIRRIPAGRSLSIPDNDVTGSEDVSAMLKGRMPCCFIDFNPVSNKVTVPPFNSDFLTVDKDSGTSKPAKLSPVKTSGFYVIAAGSFDNNSAEKIGSGVNSIDYGIGIGYRINNKLSVQTGFYAGKKKYRADKYDYYFEPGSYYTTVNLLDINADCYVYEIPLALRYDVAAGKKYIVYATAGISSYIMKRETYTYTYEKSGMVHVSGKTYTGNTHFLSVAALSAGYERKLSRNISLLAEPFIKIPLSGVGAGKVKLNSTGILLGIKYTLPHK